MTVKVLQNYTRGTSVIVTIQNGEEIRRTERAVLSGLYIESEGNRHRRKPRNLLPLTPFRVSRNIRADEPIVNEDISSGAFSKRYFTGPKYDLPWTSLSYETFDFSGAPKLNKAYAKLGGSDFNFGETLVELDQSFNMVVNSLRRLYLYFKYARDGNIKGIRALLKSSDFKLRGTTKKKRVANAYLEYQFGWSPLINDVYNAVFNTHKLVTEKGVGFARTSGRYSSDFNKLLEDRTVGRAGGVVKTPSSSALNQLGLTNPLLMAWNRLPFSFLVDWVVPISTLLGALTWTLGLSRTYSYYTTLSGHSRSVTKISLGPSEYRKKYLGDFMRGAEKKNRVIPQATLPELDYSSHSVQLSLGKITSLTALFVQLNSR